MGQITSNPMADKTIYIDAKALAFHLLPSTSETLQFDLSKQYSSKLRHYNGEGLHTIEISIKLLSGQLEEAFVTRGNLLADVQQEKSNIQTEYLVRFTPASTNNWIPATYFIHLRNGSHGATRVVIVSRIVQQVSAGDENAPEGKTTRVRSLTTLPPPSAPPVFDASSSSFEQKVGADGLSAAVTVNGDSSSGADDPGAKEQNLELADVVRKVTYYGTFPTLKIDDKAFALQIESNYRRFIAFELLSAYSSKLKRYNTESGQPNHYIAISVKVLAGSIAEAVVYRNGPNGQFSSVQDLSTGGEYLVKLTHENTAEFRTDNYYIKVVASNFGCKIVVSAHIQVEERDENGGVVERIRALTVLPPEKKNGREEEKSGGYAAGRLSRAPGNQSANDRAVELETRAVEAEENHQRQTYTSTTATQNGNDQSSPDEVEVSKNENGTGAVLDGGHVASDAEQVV